MAVDVYSSEITISSSAGISPRISFSHDLKNAGDSVSANPGEENDHQRSDLCLLDSGSDFVFCISNVFSQQLSSADELFSNGKIVPMEIKKSSNLTNKNHHRVESSPHYPQSPSTRCPEKKRLKEFLSAESDSDNEEVEERPTSKHFWQFKRSSSLNCEATPGKSLIRSLQFLSRSNSTGSVPNPKQTEISKENQKQRLQKQFSVSSVSSRRSSSSSSSSSSTYYFYSFPQKPSLKKNRSSGNGVRISPVLNLPQAYIPKVTVNFSGFGSLFCNGKIKKKKEKEK